MPSSSASPSPPSAAKAGKKRAATPTAAEEGPGLPAALELSFAPRTTPRTLNLRNLPPTCASEKTVKSYEKSEPVEPSRGRQERNVRSDKNLEVKAQRASVTGHTSEGGAGPSRGIISPNAGPPQDGPQARRKKRREAAAKIATEKAAAKAKKAQREAERLSDAGGPPAQSRGSRRGGPGPRETVASAAESKHASRRRSLGELNAALHAEPSRANPLAAPSTTDLEMAGNIAVYIDQLSSPSLEEALDQDQEGMTVKGNDNEAADLALGATGGPQGLQGGIRDRLRAKRRTWAAMGAPKSAMKMFDEDGVKLVFEDGEGPSRAWCENRVGEMGSPQHEFARDAVEELIESGAAVEESAGLKVQCMSPLTVVPKAGGKWRLIWDGRKQNTLLQTYKFKLMTLQKYRSQIVTGHNGDLAVSADISSAFHHCAVHASSQPFLGFHFYIDGQERSFMYTVLPFGLAVSPQTFCILTDTITRFWRRGCKLNAEVMEGLCAGSDGDKALAKQLYSTYDTNWRGKGLRGVRAIGYVDDFLILREQGVNCDATAADWVATTAMIKQTFADLGWCLNAKKCDWVPRHRVLFLGFIIDMKEGRFRVPNNIENDRQERYAAAVDEMLDKVDPLYPSLKDKFKDPHALAESLGRRGGIDQHQRAEAGEGGRIDALDLAALAGKLISISLAVGTAAALFCRSMFQCLNTRTHRPGCAGDKCSSRCWAGKIDTSEALLRDLHFWRHLLNNDMQGQPIHWCVEDVFEVTGSYECATDASDFAHGMASDVNAEHDIFCQMSPQEKEAGSMVRELATIDLVLATFQHSGERPKPGTVFHIRTDSLCAVYVLDGGGSGHAVGDEIAVSIFLRAQEMGILLITTWVPREQNQAADDRSKERDVAGYTITEEAMQSIISKWDLRGDRAVVHDVFASEWSRVKPDGIDIPFSSRFFQPGSRGNALTSKWDSLATGEQHVWIFPPPPLINSVVRRWRANPVPAVIIAPSFSEGQRGGDWLRARHNAAVLDSVALNIKDMTPSSCKGFETFVPQFPFTAFLVSPVEKEGKE